MHCPLLGVKRTSRLEAGDKFPRVDPATDKYRPKEMDTGQVLSCFEYLATLFLCSLSSARIDVGKCPGFHAFLHAFS
jgi:hypothetical protein